MSALRADAQRNRKLILDAAAELFARRGLGVSVQEIARSAGVGTGTVGRHFPTKNDLVEATLSQSLHALVALSVERRRREKPGQAFFPLFDAIISAAATNQSLAERMATVNKAEDQPLGASLQALCDELEVTLAEAQTSGTVRSDLSLEDVEALMAACMSRPSNAGALAGVVRSGLTATDRDGLP
ncbi:TetR/AcrR family transcriptional regulator [Actinoalloteichus spitiensis]|uniref:TetR/AcrR family transcriptional regulator n=1 Tax=Actinoalloteichus spitiensis TaxID=252394 RepID=UPI00035E812F|nr:TetR/AcrR family transcriptional regulator [Actinoalloteichus spitiensis]